MRTQVCPLLPHHHPRVQQPHSVRTEDDISNHNHYIMCIRTITSLGRSGGSSSGGGPSSESCCCKQERAV